MRAQTAPTKIGQYPQVLPTTASVVLRVQQACQELSRIDRVFRSTVALRHRLAGLLRDGRRRIPAAPVAQLRLRPQPQSQHRRRHRYRNPNRHLARRVRDRPINRATRSGGSAHVVSIRVLPTTLQAPRTPVAPLTSRLRQRCHGARRAGVTVRAIPAAMPRRRRLSHLWGSRRSCAVSVCRLTNSPIIRVVRVARRRPTTPLLRERVSTVRVRTASSSETTTAVPGESTTSQKPTRSDK